MSDVSAVNPFVQSQTGAAAAATDSVANDLGADTFLQLLVAQLKYQDPTSPAEGTEFLAQTAQFTMVEKLTQLAEQSEKSTVVSRNLGAAAMVGRDITWLRDDGTVGAGRVDSARLGSAGPVLVVDGADVPFDAVASVVDRPTTAPAPAAVSSGTAAVPTTSKTTDESTTPIATDGTTGAQAP